MSQDKTKIEPESARGGMITPNMRKVLVISVLAAIVVVALSIFAR